TIQDMIGGQQAAAQVTPAGAAIKLHFACNKNNNNNTNNNNNNNNNNSNKNKNMYAGLKTVVEHKMNIKNGNNNTNNNNNSNATNNNNNGEKSTTEMRKIFENINDGSASVYRSLGSCVSAASPLGAFRTVPRAASILVTPAPSTIMGVTKGIGPVSQTLKALQPRSCGVSLASGTMLGVTRGSSVGIVTGFPAGLRLLPAPIPKGKPPTVGGGDSAEAIMSVGKAVEAPAATKSALVTTLNPSAGQQQPTQRTEDQENAFRRIEDVHNYAKLQDYSSEDEDVEDEEEEDLDEEEEDEDEDEGDTGAKIQASAKQEVTRIRREDTEEHVDVDVVTVQQPEQECDQEKHQKEAVEIIQPEHHARRPMNAFLIFCKRHRAIVKERYKTLENRAITKILGDWWAALDEQEKHCFTDLAQQNKDAFFNANPNFKWYKLPAPPLRTLATRPSNAATGGVGSSGDDNQPSPHPTQLQLQKIPLDLLRRDYFKLADETQMGELSSLLQVQVQEKDYALQQVLSETSQFLSAHMPGATGNQPATGLKRSFDSQSSNSSEEEGATGSPNKKAKSSRSCKGKIYQELVNSGQLAAINKKGKNRNSTVSGNFTDTSLDAAPNTPPISPPERPQSSRHQRSVSESSSSGFFNLEERIKELPALSLDAYLQRKRSTKKKKKFSGSRKQRNILNSSSSGARAALPDPAVVAGDLERIKQQQQQQQLQKQQQRQQAAAVGSQRRKARKESITRRDVSAIEQEVASILPLTINGCYYFNESPVPKATCGPVSVVASNSSSPLSSNSSSFSSPNLEETSSTSDLLILAEVAANRTELTKSN
ncbi:hypothetical protein KR074_002936, partial [Drosophila pseudoananassae]